jgi:hypothetical protein
MNDIESTCMGESCPFWSVVDGLIKCPFYLQTIWALEGSHKPTVLNDCAPRRNTMLLMDYSERAIGIQKDYSNQRNKYEEVLKAIGQVMEVMQERNEMLKEKLNIKQEEEDLKMITGEEKGNE